MPTTLGAAGPAATVQAEVVDDAFDGAAPVDDEPDEPFVEDPDEPLDDDEEEPEEPAEDDPLDDSALLDEEDEDPLGTEEPERLSVR